MTETALPACFAGLPARRARTAPPRAAAVFLPKEHGSWSLALEPVVLALCLAPSAPGVALAAAVLAGFLMRRPWKAACVPLHSDSRRAAREALVVLSTLAVAGGLEVLVLGEPAALWPLLLAAPFGALFAWFDAQGESRAAASELVGCAAFAVLPAAFATLARLPAGAAMALAVLALARSVPTVFSIRVFLRRRKGRSARSFMPVLAAVAAVLAVMALAACGRLPWWASAGPALLLVRAAWLAGPWRPAWSARYIGTTEAALGLIYLLVTVLACRGVPFSP